MNYKQVAEMLPVLIAFAERRRIQYRDLRPGKNHSCEWTDINPDTTEFRLVDCDPCEWRVFDGATLLRQSKGKNE